MPTAWPTSAEVKAHLATLGVDSGAYDFSDLLDAAVEEFEERTGWSPWLFDTNATAKTFDPPQFGTLDICGGFQQSGLTSIVSDGTTLAATDYYLLPTGKAYADRVAFDPLPSSEPQSLVVTAKWGRSADVPFPAFQAVLMKVAAEYTDYQLGAFGAVSRLKQAPMEIEQGNAQGGVSAATQKARKDFGAACTRYAREVYI